MAYFFDGSDDGILPSRGNFCELPQPLNCHPNNRVGIEAGTTTQILRRLQDNLVQRFGHMQRYPDDRREPEWALVQGLIGSRMRSEASSAVANALVAMYESWDAVGRLSPAALAKDLAGVRFPNQAAKRVHNVLGAIVSRVGRVDLSGLAEMETAEALTWLEALPGIGRKIAAQVLNATTLNRRALVLDTHHLRILARMGLIGEKATTAAAYDRLMPLLPGEWDAATIDEHHMLMKELGRTCCKPRSLDCPACPALALCETGRARTTS